MRQLFILMSKRSLINELVVTETINKSKGINKDTTKLDPMMDYELFFSVMVKTSNGKIFGCPIISRMNYVHYNQDSIRTLKLLLGEIEINNEKIKELNPSLMVWCTPHNYDNFKLKLPVGTKDEFIEKIAKVKDLNPSGGFVKYKVQKGDTLMVIAEKIYKNRDLWKKLYEANKAYLKNPYQLNVGQVLVLPPGTVAAP